MEKVRGFMNRLVIIGLGLCAILGCNSADDETLERLLAEPDTTETVTTETQEPLEEPVEMLEAMTRTIDATSKEEWAYFDFATGSVVDVEDAATSEGWDIGFQRTQVKLNGGTSGPGEGSVVMLSETTFAAVTTAPTDGYRADTADTLAIVPQSEKGWYLYTGPPTHWILPLEDRVFVVKTADGTFAKLRFIGYYKDNENKQDSGFVTFEYVHQPDGSPNF